jgi:hypothetical protein
MLAGQERDAWAAVAVIGRKPNRRMWVLARTPSSASRAGAAGRVSRLLSAVGIALLGVAGASSALDAPDAPGPQAGATAAESRPLLDTVNVEAQRQRADLEHRVDAYVVRVIGNVFHEGLARWRAKVCPLVAGLPVDQGEFVLARLSAIARSAHVPLASESCKPNLYIVVASEPDELLKLWRARDRRMFDFGIGEGAIKRFLASKRPVRVWYSTAVSSEAGLPSALGSLPVAGAGVGFANLPANPVPLGTRLRRSVVRTIGSVIVVADAARLTGLSIGQLADYASMLGFVAVRTEVDVSSAPTILALFTDSAISLPQGLSAWDQALLDALYATNQASVTQLSQIQLRVMQQVAP